MINKKIKLIGIGISTCLLMACSDKTASHSKLHVYHEQNKGVISTAQKIKDFECEVKTFDLPKRYTIDTTKTDGILEAHFQEQPATTEKQLLCRFITINEDIAKTYLNVNLTKFASNFDYIGFHKETNDKYLIETGDPNKPFKISYDQNNVDDLNKSVIDILNELNRLIKLYTPIDVTEYHPKAPEVTDIKKLSIYVSYYEFDLSAKGKDTYNFYDEKTHQALKVDVSKHFDNDDLDIFKVQTSVSVPKVLFLSGWLSNQQFKKITDKSSVKNYHRLDIQSDSKLVYESLKETEVTLFGGEVERKYANVVNNSVSVRLPEININNSADAISFKPKLSIPVIKLEPIQVENQEMPLFDLRLIDFQPEMSLKAGETVIVSLPAEKNIKRVVTFTLGE